MQLNLFIFACGMRASYQFLNSLKKRIDNFYLKIYISLIQKHDFFFIINFFFNWKSNMIFLSQEGNTS